MPFADFEGPVRPKHDVVRRGDGSYVAMWRVEGLPWEALEEDMLYARRFDFNSLLVNVASERLVIGVHEVRSLADDAVHPEATYRSKFARSLDEVYRERLTTGAAPLYSNEQFLSVTVRPQEPLGRSLSHWLHSARLIEEETESETLKYLDDRLALIAARLQPWGLRRLGKRRRGGAEFSEIAEALALIHSGRRQEIPVPNGPLGDSIYAERVEWGPRRTIRTYDAAGRTRYAATFGFKIPGPECHPWIFNHLKAAPFCYSFSRHFHCLHPTAGDKVLTRRQNRAPIAHDPAVNQLEALGDLRSRLMERRVVMGNHCNVLTVFCDSPDELEVAAPIAQTRLAAGGALVVREDIADLAAYWSHLPGNLDFWPRPMPISSENYASMASLSAYPLGPETGRWGTPATTYRSSGGTAVRFHLHVRDVGNIGVFGPTGSGKTAWVMHLLCQAEKYGPRIVFYDQYRGASIGVRALGGDYHVLQDGVDCGLAPLKTLSADDPRDMAMLRLLARGMIGGEIDREDQRAISLALRMVMEMPASSRSWGEVRAFLGYDRNGIGERLEIWCRGNELGWALDSRESRERPDSLVTGYDTTGLLGNKQALGAIQAYLAYRTERQVDGQKMIVVIDEFHHWLEDEFWARRAASLARTIRRRNGVLIMLTQHPADLVRCPFGHTIMQQTPQQLFFPDPRAKEEYYIGGAQITEPMFDLIKRLMAPGAGQFLRVVDGTAMVCELPLGGLPAHMSVLSAREETSNIAAGIDGDDWLDQFMRCQSEMAAAQ